jgi:Phosphate-selective porin O and P
MKKPLIVFTIIFCYSLFSIAQNTPTSNDTIKKEWYQEINLRGYAQLRYNGLIQTNPDLTCEQCDKSWGGDSDFFFRRIRLVFYGQIHPRVYFYIQPDFASASGSYQHYGQIRDAYVDVGLDAKNEFRFRIGQSKVPFGFENLQSSQNRLTLDRNDALNSAVRNERDLGVFFYWAPKKIRERFSMLVKEGYKGSGDYGVFGFGAYNGQTANVEELNNKKHIVARVTYPFEIGSQIFEAGIQAYTGDYTIDSKQISDGVAHNEDNTYIDQRFAVTAILYPKPFGIQAEYNIGKGPEFDKLTNSINVQNLHGGYLTLNAKLQINKQLIYPFAKLQYYNGGKKHELDARSYDVKELEVGLEWLPYKSIEFVAAYTFSDRRYEDFINPDNRQTGSLLRLQFQVNF